MPITTIWDDDKQTIVRQVFEGQWTWDELYASWDRGNEIMNSADRPLSFIVDMRNGTLLPSDALKHVKRIGDLATQVKLPPTMVLVGGNAFIRAFWDTFSKIYGAVARQFDICFVATLEEARAIIAERR